MSCAIKLSSGNGCSPARSRNGKSWAWRIGATAGSNLTGYDHLFEPIGEDWGRKRAQELIEALDEYYEAVDAANDLSGCNAADEVSGALHAKIDDLLDRMLELKPSTLAGYRAMALAVVNCCWSGEVRRGFCTDLRMIAAILSGLTDVPVAA
jgi:hypothetical protein